MATAPLDFIARRQRAGFVVAASMSTLISDEPNAEAVGKSSAAADAASPLDAQVADFGIEAHAGDGFRFVLRTEDESRAPPMRRAVRTQSDDDCPVRRAQFRIQLVLLFIREDS